MEILQHHLNSVTVVSRRKVIIDKPTSRIEKIEPGDLVVFRRGIYIGARAKIVGVVLKCSSNLPGATITVGWSGYGQI
jgi:hypothetical protein